MTDGSRSLDLDLARRGLIAGGLAAAALPVQARGKVGALLDQAIRFAGGAKALTRAKVLAWAGEAVIHTGGRTLEIEVDTVVRPFDQARSDSWPKGRGADIRRGLVLQGDAGFLERDGLRSPMPDAMRRHERQQYAVYGLMRLVTLDDKGAALAREDRGDLRGLSVVHPLAPPCWMGFDRFGRLVRLENRVSSPQADPDVDQVFTFAGAIQDHGVRWPRTISIAQNGKPYFDLTLKTFSARGQF